MLINALLTCFINAVIQG